MVPVLCNSAIGIAHWKKMAFSLQSRFDCATLSGDSVKYENYRVVSSSVSKKIALLTICVIFLFPLSAQAVSREKILEGAYSEIGNGTKYITEHKENSYESF
jgi:hypothetical protein